MPDGAIVLPDTSSAPKDYTLAGTQEIQLKSVRALIDGSGAGSAFLPTLQLLDPNGHVCWEGATPSTVAAGGSADVSWFPGLGVQSSGPAPVPTSTNWAYIDSNETPVACPAGTSTRIAADSTTFYTNSTGIFDAHTSSGGVMGMRILADGHYRVAMSALASGLLAAGDVAQLVIEGGGAFADFGLQFPIDFLPVAGFNANLAYSEGVMSVGTSISPPTDAIVCRIDNLAGGHTLHYAYTGLVVVQLDAVNHDL